MGWEAWSRTQQRKVKVFVCNNLRRRTQDAFADIFRAAARPKASHAFAAPDDPPPRDERLEPSNTDILAFYDRWQKQVASDPAKAQRAILAETKKLCRTREFRDTVLNTLSAIAAFTIREATRAASRAYKTRPDSLRVDNMEEPVLLYR